MRILVYSWRDLAHPLAGGAEVYTHQVARQWVRAGHEVTLFSSTFAGSIGEEERDGVRVIRRARGRHRLYWEARRFYAQQDEGSFDLVIDQINTRPFWCQTFVRDATVIALAYQIAREIWFYETPLPVAILGRFVFERRWLRRYRNVPTVTLSESSKASLEGYGLRKVTVIPPGFTEPPVEAPGAGEEDGSEPTLIYVGRLTRNKRPHHAIRAFRQVRRSIPSARLWIVGSGPMESRLRRMAEPGVTFFGRVDSATKYELMARANVLVMTSVREGWGLAVTEAASMGTTAVTYDVDGLRDSVGASGGYLASPDPSSLGNRVVEVLSDSARRIPQPAGTLSWDEVADGILRVAGFELSGSDHPDVPAGCEFADLP